jgi:hypothetical protein
VAADLSTAEPGKPANTEPTEPAGPGETAETTERAAAPSDSSSNSASEPALDTSATAASENTGREIKYMVSPEGVRVRVDGVEFTPAAEATKVGKGWGIKVRVEAKSQDEATHSLLAPKDSEIAFAGHVKRAGKGELEEFGDRREGDRSLDVTPKKSVKLARTWPQKDGPQPLGPGDELRLEIGIWGLGADAGSRRPVKKLVRIDVKFDKDKPRVKVAAPEGVAK